jgi:hypothetical protein
MIRVRLITNFSKKYLYVTCINEGLVRFEKDRTSENRLFCPCWGPCHRPNWTQPMGMLEAVKSTNESRARVVQNILKPLLHGMCRHRSPQSTNSWLAEGVFSKILGWNSGNIYGSLVQLRMFEPVCSWCVIHQVFGSLFYDQTNKVVSGVRGVNVRNRPATTVTQKCTVGSRIWPTHLSDDSYGTPSIRKYLSLFCFICS